MILTKLSSLVAVHGLNFSGAANHGTATWEKDGKIWLRDFLPDVLPMPARVFLYEYNASPAIAAGATKLDDHARKLLVCLEQKRMREVAQRPLVFIAHSMGGLLVKEALVEATLDDSYSEILRSTKLLVFFGTPHRGGNHATVGDYVARLYKTMARNPRNDLVESLREFSDTATKRYEQFRHKLEDFLIISFFETLPYSKVAGLIVDKHSATLNLPGKREKQISIDADHSSMCKFAGLEGTECETVILAISQQLERSLATFVDLRRGSHGIPN
ncbi:hypothetical protein BDV95DRAFT_397503 [Massariosphaeria phaeospora]|uniref:DUF676 domain-containing protein n=1 Tax=Massariosphaeria phaeospora TaxID=100035 RepID=A0A7C8MBK0_9PLEO|nr:hypothetical protein BDV95DRAFT_397503 [Massariosphaeria phaeospora]